MKEHWIEGPVVIDLGAARTREVAYAGLLAALAPQVIGTLTPEGRGAGEYPGCREPLVRALYARQTKRKQRKEPAEVPRAPRDPQKKHGVAFLTEACKQGPVTVLALGTLTNLAMALRITPEIAGNLREVVILEERKGLTFESVKQDPEAAQILMESGVPLSFVSACPASAPEQTRRLARPGNRFQMCLTRGYGEGMLIPAEGAGAVRFFDGEEREPCGC